MDTTNRTRSAGIGVATVLGVVAAWWALRPTPAPLEPVAPVVEQAPRPAEPSPALVRATEPATTTADFLPDGQPIRPAGGPTQVDTSGMAPHGHTPQHLRIFRENNFVRDLNSAMDNQQVPELRRLLQQYREEYPEDANVLQDGYELIASCQDHLTPEKRATAQRYYDEELDSGVRRYIRRYCLEAP
jgi:hypothetical protein